MSIGRAPSSRSTRRSHQMRFSTRYRACDDPVMGERLLAALAEIRPQLEVDPLFHDGGFSMAKLEGLLSRGPDDDLATLFGDTLQGMIQGARYGGIQAVHQLHRAAGTLHTRPALAIREGHTEVFIGSLRVHGDVEN